MVKRGGERLPEPGELVVCTATNVKKFGAFVSLDEYSNREGFIHVTEVTTGWVKYIRNYIREGQKVVCKVIRVEEEKGHIDLSLKQVNEHQRREKIRAWKNENKAEKLLEFVAEAIKKDVEGCMHDFGNKLIETYGSLYGAFEECSINRSILEEDGFDGEWIKPFVQIAVDNITPPYVNIRGHLDLSHSGPKGVLHIRDALKSGEKDGEDITITTHYIGAPRYEIYVKAPDYKLAEEELKNAADNIIRTITEAGGTGEFHRKRE